jgi:hypothetical protein
MKPRPTDSREAHLGKTSWIGNKHPCYQWLSYNYYHWFLLVPNFKPNYSQLDSNFKNILKIHTLLPKPDFIKYFYLTLNRRVKLWTPSHMAARWPCFFMPNLVANDHVVLLRLMVTEIYTELVECPCVATAFNFLFLSILMHHRHLILTMSPPQTHATTCHSTPWASVFSNSDKLP